jgi:hypothetical protein
MFISKVSRSAGASPNTVSQKRDIRRRLQRFRARTVCHLTLGWYGLSTNESIGALGKIEQVARRSCRQITTRGYVRNIRRCELKRTVDLKVVC